MKPITKIWIILMTALLFSGCLPLPQIAGTAAASDQQVKAIAENVLQALNEGNYEIFHKDFSEAMLTAFPETEFTKLRDILLTSSGKYRINPLDLSSSQPEQTNMSFMYSPARSKKKPCSLPSLLQWEATKSKACS